MSAPKSGPQDMPPEGGYNPIITARNKLKKIVTAKRALAFFATSQIVGWYFWAKQDRHLKFVDIEKRSARFVLWPFLLAERDREYLKQLRKNREYERELMKDYPDWEVGTYFGEPIFETIDPNEEWVNPKYSEYIVHAPNGYYQKVHNMHHWT